MKHPREAARAAATALHPVLVTAPGDGRVLYQNALSLALFGRLQRRSELAPAKEIAAGLLDLETRRGRRLFLLEAVERSDFQVLVFKDVSELEPLLGRPEDPTVGGAILHPCDRRDFLYQLAREIARAERNLESFQLALISVDQAGDIRAARGADAIAFVHDTVGELIRSTIRQVDVLGRYDGDRFGLILPNTDAGGGLWVAERTRRLIESAPFVFDEAQLAVSVSLGLTEFRPTDTPEHLLQRAAEALAQARDWGASQVQCRLD